MAYDNLLVVSAFKTASLVFFSFSMPFILLAVRKFRQNKLEETVAGRLIFATAFGMLFTAYENFAPKPSWTVSIVMELAFCASLIWTILALEPKSQPKPALRHSPVIMALPPISISLGVFAKLSLKVYAMVLVLKSFSLNNEPSYACSKRLRSFLEVMCISLLMFAVSDVVVWSQTYSWGIYSLASLTFFYAVWNWYSGT